MKGSEKEYYNITQEHSQKANCLTHLYQQSLREKKLTELNLRLKEKKLIHVKSRATFNCEKRLFQLMKVENNNLSHLTNVAIANLMSYTGDELKVLIIVRKDELL